ncbi:MAG: nucleotidyl transferase AbiEii/AbiGii toxin family protein [Candidatus Micrarchaeia archaeon]
MNIPLANRLRKRGQRDVALFQDVLVRILYEADATTEIHGGTAIWRCYGGKRFSKDIDVYLSSKERWDNVKRLIESAASRYNAKVIKLKETGNLVFIELLLDGIYSEIEINYNRYYKGPVIRQYENLDGTFYDVLTLPAEALIEEKISAYTDRRLITDLYDIRILIDHADTKKIGGKVKKFISSISRPEDLKREEARLADLIFEGPVPSFASLVEYIRGKVS